LVNFFVSLPTALAGNPTAAILVARRVVNFWPFFFPIVQRRHSDFGVFRVGMMHRLGIMSQRLLCEPLRVGAMNPVDSIWDVVKKT
jgi:hypothetical protein